MANFELFMGSLDHVQEELTEILRFIRGEEE